MINNVLERLNNAPYHGEDAFKELEGLVNEKLSIKDISKEEKERLDYELSFVKKWGMAKHFLFGKLLVQATTEEYKKRGKIQYCETGTLWRGGCSYVNFLLGLSPVNPVIYNLPFEKYFNEYRNYLPTHKLFIPSLSKGSVLNRIYEEFGKSNIIRAENNSHLYFYSSKPIKKEYIKKTINLEAYGYESCEENISTLTTIELSELGYYSFEILEGFNFYDYVDKKFSEEEIYERYKIERDDDFFPDIKIFEGLEEVKVILKDTEYKLVYQEQVLEILNKLCGFDMAKADFYRLEMENLEPSQHVKHLETLLTEKYGEDGKALFDYLHTYSKSTMSKICPIAYLHKPVW